MNHVVKSLDKHSTPTQLPHELFAKVSSPFKPSKKPTQRIKQDYQTR